LITSKCNGQSFGPPLWTSLVVWRVSVENFQDQIADSGPIHHFKPTFDLYRKELVLRDLFSTPCD